MKKLLLILLAGFLIWKLFASHNEVTSGLGGMDQGEMAPAQPVQISVSTPEQYIVDDYTINQLASFQIKAKVLGRKNYHFGREADLSPVDLALGWGSMSDDKVLQKISISQSNRWYHWRVDDFPVPRREIETHSANMHLIPADRSVAAAIKKVHKGDLIELSGSLVSVQANDGWQWQSSLTREDTGNYSCELIWVDSFKVLRP